ncbi:phosphotransferase [Pseudoalteromonas aliena]|uniref:phosphotransferase n=1 Tax=Pseudoalteromonas aliena TaxID=247523 RepID=UPI00311F5401
MIEHTQLVKVCSAFIEPTSIVSTERLLNGFSNDNFLIRTQQHAYLLKYYKSKWPTVGLKAQHDLSNQHICPKPIWTDEVNKYAAFDYIEGDIAQASFSKDLINKLIKVHNYTVSTTRMNITRELIFYQCSNVYQQNKSHLERALKAIANMPFNEGFCHNDLVKENIIVNDSGMYLIDFEYAQINDVYFDLAAIVVSFNLGERCKSALLENYESCVEHESGFYSSMYKLDCYTLVFLVLCIGWYEQRDVNSKSLGLRAQLTKLISHL